METIPELKDANMKLELVGEVSWFEGSVLGAIYPTDTMPKDGDKLYIIKPTEK